MAKSDLILGFSKVFDKMKYGKQDQQEKAVLNERNYLKF
jgi:hypothetical protein